MKKLFLIFILISIPLFFLMAEDVTYVYKNSISSVGLDRPQIGNSYFDNDGNLLVVSQKRGEVTEFDIVRTKTTVKTGNELTKKRFPLMFAEVLASLKNVGACISMNTFAYPVSAMFAFDTTYGFKEKNAYIGLKADIPLSNLSEDKFTMIEDGSLFAYSLFGIDLNLLKEEYYFAAKWGLGYKHIIGSVFWSVEYSCVWKLVDHSSVSDFSLGFGVMI